MARSEDQRYGACAADQVEHQAAPQPAGPQHVREPVTAGQQQGQKQVRPPGAAGDRARLCVTGERDRRPCAVGGECGDGHPISRVRRDRRANRARSGDQRVGAQRAQPRQLRGDHAGVDQARAGAGSPYSHGRAPARDRLRSLTGPLEMSSARARHRQILRIAENLQAKTCFSTSPRRGRAEASRRSSGSRTFKACLTPGLAVVHDRAQERTLRGRLKAPRTAKGG